MRAVIAAVLGLAGLVLVFALGEGLQSAARRGVSPVLPSVILAAGVALYFSVSQFLLSRGNPGAMRTDWPLVLCLNATLIVGSVIAVVAEPNRAAAFQFMGITVAAIVCSFLGAAVAGRAARR